MKNSMLTQFIMLLVGATQKSFINLKWFNREKSNPRKGTKNTLKKAYLCSPIVLEEMFRTFNFTPHMIYEIKTGLLEQKGKDLSDFEYIPSGFFQNIFLTSVSIVQILEILERLGLKISTSGDIDIKNIVTCSKSISWWANFRIHRFDDYTFTTDIPLGLKNSSDFTKCLGESHVPASIENVLDLLLSLAIEAYYKNKNINGYIFNRIAKKLPTEKLNIVCANPYGIMSFKPSSYFVRPIITIKKNKVIIHYNHISNLPYSYTDAENCIIQIPSKSDYEHPFFLPGNFPE